MIRKLLTTILLVISALMILPVNQVKAAESVVTIKETIVKHSIDMGIDPALALSIAKQESGFCHTKTSRHGAVGVFQLMPNTARKLGYNPYNLNENIRGGLMYYKMMYQMFGSTELALAAYNAGPGNVKNYNGIPPFSETKKFISSIMNDYNAQKNNPDPIVDKYLEHTKQREKDKVLSTFMNNQAI